MQSTAASSGPLAGTSIVADPLELIGGTPLVRLGPSVGDPDCVVAAKLEMFNPGGSVKDRAALSMVVDAERRGLLRPGGTIVEPTSGNTGVGLAIVAARRGYRCVFVMPDKMAPEKSAVLRAYGAEVVTCPTAVAPDDPRSYYSVARRLSETIDGAWQPDQYHNPANPAAHSTSTGPEIWEQTGGRVTHFVAGAGTGGTVSGVARYLKERDPGIQIVVADPVGSVYSGGDGRPYMVEGVGEDFWPGNYDPKLVDRVVEVSDTDSFAAARRAARQEGLLLGGSSGTAIAAAAAVAAAADPDALIVVLCPDTGRNYLSRFHDDGWMASHGFAGPTRGAKVRLADAVAASQGQLPDLVHTHPHESVRDALEVAKEFGVSQLPVLAGEPPATLAEVVGTVTTAQLSSDALAGRGSRPVGEVMLPRLPVAGAGEPASVIAERGGDGGAVLVIDEGRPVGVLSAADVSSLLGEGH